MLIHSANQPPNVITVADCKSASKWGSIHSVLVELACCVAPVQRGNARHAASLPASALVPRGFVVVDATSDEAGAQITVRAAVKADACPDRGWPLCCRDQRDGRLLVHGNGRPGRLPPWLRASDDPDGDRHAKSGHPVKNVTSNLRLGSLIEQNVNRRAKRTPNWSAPLRVDRIKRQI